MYIVLLIIYLFIIAISNEIIRTFESHRPIIALYFQSMRSYELDKGTPLLINRMRHLSSADNDLLLQVKGLSHVFNIQFIIFCENLNTLFHLFK
mgnify:CR=1 FL=1